MEHDARAAHRRRQRKEGRQQAERGRCQRRDRAPQAGTVPCRAVPREMEGGCRRTRLRSLLRAPAPLHCITSIGSVLHSLRQAPRRPHSPLPVRPCVCACVCVHVRARACACAQVGWNFFHPFIHVHALARRWAGTSSCCTPRAAAWCARGRAASRPSASWRSTWASCTAPGAGLRSRWGRGWVLGDPVGREAALTCGRQAAWAGAARGPRITRIRGGGPRVTSRGRTCL